MAVAAAAAPVKVDAGMVDGGFCGFVLDCFTGVGVGSAMVKFGSIENVSFNVVGGLEVVGVGDMDGGNVGEKKSMVQANVDGDICLSLTGFWEGFVNGDEVLVVVETDVVELGVGVSATGMGFEVS